MTGGFTNSLGDYSTGAAQVILPHVVGSIEVYEQQTAWPVVLENSKVVVWWGANPLATLRISWTSNDGDTPKYLEDLKNSGKEIYIIDPSTSATTEFFGDKAKRIKPIPNTDVAMMLGMANHLFKTNQYDKNFIENYTVGFDKFTPYLIGKSDGVDKTPEWAEKICGIEAKVIKELAEKFYKNRTMLMAGWAMQRQHHGEQPHWMLVTLASMLGQIGLPGGGFGFSYHYSGGGNPTCKGAVLGGIDAGTQGLYNKNNEFIGLKGKVEAKDSDLAPWIANSGANSFPVARISDALLNPGKTIDFNGRKITYPDIDFIYWAGGNPICHQQQVNKNVKAWRKPRTVVVNSIYWTPTARMADVVFPITTEYERNDITMAGDYSNKWVAPMKQVVEKQNDAVDDYKVFSDLCLAYGGEKLYDAYTDGGKNEFDWIKKFYDAAYNSVKAIPDFNNPLKEFSEFWNDNKPVSFEPTPESEAYVRYADFREDPILESLGTPSGLIEIYSETIEKMHYNDCGPHPKWYEPVEWLGMKDKPAEFAMTSPHSEYRLHSQLSQTGLRDKYAVAGHEPIYMNSEDAKKKGIKDGDVVRVFNKRGEALAGAVLDDGILSGVVRLKEGAWYDPSDPSKPSLCRNGLANVMTLDIPTSKLAQANIAHTCLVNVEKYNGKNLEVNVFNEPKTLDKL